MDMYGGTLLVKISDSINFDVKICFIRQYIKKLESTLVLIIV